MKIKLPQTLNAILAGTALGAVGSVMLSLTLEPEISEVRMGQYGAFIGLIASATSVAIATGSDSYKRSENAKLPGNKSTQQSGSNTFLQELVKDAAEKHLNRLQPGSLEYFEALELYGKMVLPENDTLPTNNEKPQALHHIQRGDYR